MPKPRTPQERLDWCIGTMSGLVATLLDLGVSHDRIHEMINEAIKSAEDD